jgi:hypothetical protein
VPAGQTLYEYHVPGGYEDAELDFHPLLAKDLKGLAPFAEPAGRNPTYQVAFFVWIEFCGPLLRTRLLWMHESREFNVPY